MNPSRKRVLDAMNLIKPDRIPVMSQFSIGCMMNQLSPSSPSKFWYDEETFSKGLVVLCEKFKFDGILVSLHGHSPNWQSSILSKSILENGDELLEFEERTELHSLNDLPLVKYKKQREKLNIDDIDVSNCIPLLLDYIPVSQDLYFHLDQNNLFGIYKRIYNLTDGKYSIHGEITSPFDYLLDLLGYEQGLISLILSPDKCKEILSRFTNSIMRLVEKMCDCEIDAIKISSPFAGMGFISPEHYSEFVLPYESQIIEVIKSKGKHVYIHTCGHIDDRLELMQSSGASGLECLDPPPVGNVDLADAFNRIGDKMFIKGNIDSVNTLLYGDDNKAREDILKIIDVGKSYPGFILSTACSIAPKVHSERILLLSDLIS